ncbi:hypothetical protein [Massilia oculi]|uniref:hypothetical protein n=1 Tax=Massilia oculi TaxID=945844 RepID=UPI001AAF531B|nr:hypothetical protein [Massilia oculi]
MAIVATHVAAVQELYVAYFGRPADPAGLDYWTNVVEAQGGSTTAVSASFSAQPEYIVAFYQKTPAQIVDQIYSNMFARGTSTTDGRSYWVDLLSKGTVSVSTIVAEVAKGAQGTDAEAVENKVAAATAFTAALDTAAEQAGYAGADSLNLAKAFIAGITTDATLESAIAPAALNATVAGVVKAGTPFSLQSAMTELRAANKEQADFLKENDLTKLNAPTELQGDITAAAAPIDAVVTGFAANNGKPAVQAALLAQAEADMAATLTTERGELAAARAAANTAGVLARADNLAAATTAAKSAADALVVAGRVEDAAVATVEARAGGTREVTLVTDTTTGKLTSVTIDPAAGATSPDDVTLIRVNSTTGALSLAPGVTEAAYPGVTALMTAIRDHQDAVLLDTTAKATLSNAQAEVTKLSADEQALVGNVATETTQVAAAQKAITDLDKLVVKWEAAVALQAEYKVITDAVDAATKAFEANGYVAPAPLDNAVVGATSASDIFILGTATATTLTGFGASGNDSIFVGTEYKLNAGALSTGDDAALEVFFVQNGGRAEIHVETKAYGSDSGDVSVITLVGVDATDLQLNNGVITLNPNA